MKKLSLSLMAAAAMFFSVQEATAQVTGEDRTTMEERQQQQDDYQQIETQDLPEEVQQAVERDFQGATISEAYVKEQDGENKYRIVLSTQQGQQRELFADEQGNWIQEDGMNREQK